MSVNSYDNDQNPIAEKKKRASSIDIGLLKNIYDYTVMIWKKKKINPQMY